MNSVVTAVRRPLVVLLAAWPALGLSTEYGEAAVTAYDLEEIVVTASRRAESALAMPYTIHVRGMQELQQALQVRTVPDALRDLPGVMIQKTGHGQGSPYIRGFTGLRTLFLIDGIRLNNSTFREGPNQYWNTVDPLSAWRLEVVKGPTSVLYGSDAIGGTVNAISRSVRDLNPQGGLSSRLYMRGASAENSMVLRPEIAFAGERVDVMAAVSYKKFGDLHGGRDIGTQPMTGYDEVDADLKLHYNLSDNQRLVAGLQRVDQDDAWRVHKTVFAKSWEGATTGNELRRSLDQQRTLVYLQYRAADLSPAIDELVLSLSQHLQDESRDRIRADGRVDLQGVDVRTTGLFGHVVLPSVVGTWTAGAEYYRDAVNSWRQDFNADGTLRSVAIQGPVADDASYDSAAVFIQDQLPIGERSELILGLRHTRAGADARAVFDPLSGERVSISDDWSATTASARFRVRLDTAGRSALFGGVSQGFRAPNLSDLTRFDTARSNEIETPVPHLDAEKFLSFELGAKYAGERWTSQAAIWHTDIGDMIIRTPTGAIIDGANEITKLNAGDGYVHGVELQLRFALSNGLSLFGNATWMNGEVDTYPTSEPLLAREPLDRLMPLSLNAGARWSPPDSPWWIEGHLRFADPQETLSTRDASDTDRIPPGGTPGHSVLTLRGGWKLSEILDVSLALENVGDEDYRVHGSGLNEPGRNVVVSVIWAP